MTSVTPVSVPVVVSEYVRTHFEGDRVVYTKHVHEGSTDTSVSGAKHKVLELGYVTYSRGGLEKQTPILGTIMDIRV